MTEKGKNRDKWEIYLRKAVLILVILCLIAAAYQVGRIRGSFEGVAMTAKKFNSSLGEIFAEVSDSFFMQDDILYLNSTHHVLTEFNCSGQIMHTTGNESMNTFEKVIYYPQTLLLVESFTGCKMIW